MHQRKVAVLGLGYVGLPVAVALAQVAEVIAFDINKRRIDALRGYEDHTGEVEAADLKHSNLILTDQEAVLVAADFYIVAVPTPINEAKQPDLAPLIKASEIVGRQLREGDIVVYESTVYPGATEEICLPILERISKLQAGTDFFLGYSPERINPGDKAHRFTTIKKIVSGQTAEALEIIAKVYGSVVQAGVYRASSIRVAEAAKVIENTQRDLNIAFINELAMICHRLEIDTQDVLDAAATKWNFLPFRPGLVGGHCIGVDPYYLTHKAVSVGLHPEVILAGRRVNDRMGAFIAQETVKLLAQAQINLKTARIGILGLSFKENCSDIRNTKVVDIYQELLSYGIEPLVHDPLADPESSLHEYGIRLHNWEALENLDAIILAVAHEVYLQKTVTILQLFGTHSARILIDVKSALARHELAEHNVRLWRL